MIVTKLNNRIRSSWLHVRPVRTSKVVGIGLPKTGTTSLGYCLRRFGYKHQTFDMDLALKVKRKLIDEVMKEAEKHESFEDWPWFLLYKEFDQKFPNTKFILTLRQDTATYVRSLQGHHDREGIRDKDFIKPYWWDEVQGMDPHEWDYEKSAQRYEHHNRAVLDYFQGRIDKDLLVVCWEKGDGWDRLGQFLNKRTPIEPFPHFR